MGATEYAPNSNETTMVIIMHPPHVLGRCDMPRPQRRQPAIISSSFNIHYILSGFVLLFFLFLLKSFKRRKKRREKYDWEWKRLDLGTQGLKYSLSRVKCYLKIHFPRYKCKLLSYFPIQKLFAYYVMYYTHTVHHILWIYKLHYAFLLVL